MESSRRKSIGSDQVYYLTDNNFEVTEDIIKLFGEGCTAQEYKVMLSYYDTMKNDYPSITESQKKLLLRYVRAAAREEIATNSGNTAEAEKWGKLSSDALKQLNQSDLQGGISSFSEFFQKVERTKDVIRILPKYRYRPNDALDFVIWCFINYCRRLEGKTECAYEDVYKFYDEKWLNTSSSMAIHMESLLMIQQFQIVNASKNLLRCRLIIIEVTSNE